MKMKKTLLYSLTSVLPITTFCNQVNFTLKSQNLLGADWIEENTIEKEKLHAPQLLKNKTNLYSNKQITIDIIKNHSNKSIAVINAKKVEKKYYLSLKNDHFYNQEQLQDFIIAKFYREKTSEHFIPSERFYSFLDTKDGNGQITQNSTIQFRSSWGVYNAQEVDSSIKFNIKEEKIKEYIWMHDRNNLPEGIHPNRVEVESLQPKKIGLLPIVQIHQPPIRDAKWTTQTIRLNDQNNYYTYRDDSQYLEMPEGHNSGAEWWRGITSAIGPILAVVTGGIGGLGFAFKTALARFVAGALLGGVSTIVDKIIDTYTQVSIKDGIAILEQLYNKIMYNPIWIYPNKIDINNLTSMYLSTFINGKLWAQANATSIWGSESKMDLFAVWGAINSDVWYRVYN